MIYSRPIGKNAEALKRIHTMYQAGYSNKDIAWEIGITDGHLGKILSEQKKINPQKWKERNAKHIQRLTGKDLLKEISEQIQINGVIQIQAQLRDGRKLTYLIEGELK